MNDLDRQYIKTSLENMVENASKEKFERYIRAVCEDCKLKGKELDLALDILREIYREKWPEI